MDNAGVALGGNNDESRKEDKATEVDFVLNNADQKSHLWFYFDVDYNKLLYLNGFTEVKESNKKTIYSQQLLWEPPNITKVINKYRWHHNRTVSTFILFYSILH